MPVSDLVGASGAEDRRQKVERGSLSSVSRRRGIALIWTAVLLMVLLLFVGLALDGAHLFLVATQLHNAADAAALAGAQVVKFDQVVARRMAVATGAVNYADQLRVSLDYNWGNLAVGDVVLGRWIRQTRQFIPTTDMPNAVKAVARRMQGLSPESPPVSLFLMPLAGLYTADVGRYAIARSRAVAPALIALAAYPDWTHGPTGLWIHGTGTIAVTGDIQVNSVADPPRGPWHAMLASGDSLTIECGEINVVGTTDPPSEDPRWENYFPGPIPTSITEGALGVEDPLGYLSPPEIPAQTWLGDQTITSETIFTYGTIVGPISGIKSKVLTLRPGYYPGGISLNQSTWTDAASGETYVLKLELRAGLYALAGGTTGNSGLCLTGGSIVGEGVTIYITGPDWTARNVKYGQVDIGGNVSVRLISPGDLLFQTSGNPDDVRGAAGVVIWQDPTNLSPARIIGSSGLYLAGVLYFKNNHLEIGGGGYQAGNQLIAASIDLHGTGLIGVPYDGRNLLLTYASVLVK